MKEYLFSDTGFLLLSIIPAIPWLIFAYWAVLLYRRIQLVSRSLYPIPENVYWMERARLAKATDTECQVLERKKNIAGAVFLVVILVEFILMLSTF